MLCKIVGFDDFSFSLQFEAKVVLARLIQAYDISIVPGTGVKIQQKLTLRPRGGVPATFRPR